MTDKQITALLLNPATARQGFSALVETYGPRLYWQIRRYVLSHDDANDVLQNTFLKAWQALADFEQRSQVSTWLSRIAINEALSFLRSQKKLHDVDPFDPHSVCSALCADEYFDGSRAEALLQQAIATLPPAQRLVFNMRYFEEKTYGEMSRLLNLTEGGLKANYHLAVKKVADYVKRHQELF